MSIPEMPDMTQEQAYKQMIAAMRVLCADYSVAVFTPDELGGVDPNVVEAAMISAGWQCIQLNQQREHT